MFIYNIKKTKQKANVYVIFVYKIKKTIEKCKYLTFK